MSIEEAIGFTLKATCNLEEGTDKKRNIHHLFVTGMKSLWLTDDARNFTRT